MQVHTYLNFDGRCEEALDFYREALGAEVTSLMRFEDSPETAAAHPDVAGDRVLHATFRIGETTLWAMDGPGQDDVEFDGFLLSLVTKTDAETKRLFARLADGGQVREPLTPTFFSSLFGMVTDRFGMGWVVMTAPAEAPPTPSGRSG